MARRTIRLAKALGLVEGPSFASAPFEKSRQKAREIPIPLSVSGQSGQPGAAFASDICRRTQNVSGEDDIRLAHEEDDFEFPPPPETWRESRFMQFVREAKEEDEPVIDGTDETDPEEPELPEASTTAAVSGYTGPLGYSPPVPGGKKRKPTWKPYADAMARAKPA